MYGRYEVGVRFIANTMIGSVRSIVKYFFLENISTVIISKEFDVLKQTFVSIDCIKDIQPEIR